MDKALQTAIVSVDPNPRVDVACFANEVHRARVETLEADAIAARLDAGDILFIDSSHVLAIGGDVSFLYFDVLPRLRPGVLIHIHDIFLPYEYPQESIASPGSASTNNCSSMASCSGPTRCGSSGRATCCRSRIHASPRVFRMARAGGRRACGCTSSTDEGSARHPVGIRDAGGAELRAARHGRRPRRSGGPRRRGDD